MYRGLQIYKIPRKDEYAWYEGICQKENELATLIQTIRIYTQDIGTEFAIEKCAMLIMKNEKGETMERTEQPNLKSIRTFGEKENYKYSGILIVDIIKQRRKK